MEGKKAPSRAIILLARDLMGELQRCGAPVDGDDWSHQAVVLAHQLHGVIRYGLRADPVPSADVVSADRWRGALLNLAATHPTGREAELTRLLARAHIGRTPLEVAR